MAGHIDEMRQVAREALHSEDTEEAKLKMEEEAKKNSAIEYLRKQRQFFLEVILVRHIENFLNYLSDLLFRIFTERPETMKSSEKVDVEFVLGHTDMATLVQNLAERKVMELSYKSFADLTKFFDERFDIDILETTNSEDVQILIEIRNISVHNRCIVNSQFVARTHSDKSDVGKLFKLFGSRIEGASVNLSHLVKTCDQNAISKLKLSSEPFEFHDYKPLLKEKSS